MTTAVSVVEATDTMSQEDTIGIESSSTGNNKNLLENMIVVNPLLNEFVDCIENLPSRLQLLVSELRNVDAQVNLQHRRIQLIRQQIVSKTIEAATTSLSSSKSDGGSNSSTGGSDIDGPGSNNNNNINNTVDITETKSTIEQLLNKLHQTLLQCQLLGDQKVKLTGQIMEILSSKTRRLGLDAKSNEERDFQVELDEEKIVNEFKIAIKKRSIHAKKNQLSNGSTVHNNRVSSRHVHTAHSLQTGSSKTKQQHLNSAEINKAVAKYTKTSTGSNSTSQNTNNNFKFLSNNRNSCNPMDAYSFDNDDQQASMDTLNNRLKSGSNKHDSENDTKSLRTLNNLMNGTGKKSNLRSKLAGGVCYSEMKLNGSLNNKKSAKKLRDMQYGSSPKSKSKGNDGGQQSLNNRPKRHLNYTNNTPGDSKANSDNISASKKRRLDQVKSNRQLNSPSHGLSLSNENSINQCNSPSSSSTSSMNNTMKLKSNRLNKLNSSNSNKLIKHEKTTKDTGRLKRKSSQLKRNVEMKTRMLKKNKKSPANKSPYMQRRQNNRNIENQDDADDDLSDEIDEYSATAFDTDNNGNENDEDMDIENREFNHTQKIQKTSDNEDLNSNETESINELDDLNPTDNEDIEDEEQDEDEENPGNVSNLTENDNETDDDIYKTNTKSTNKRIKSLLYSNNQKLKKSQQQQQQMNNVFPSESEPIYCICSEISYGQMICCDNDSCKIEWFHFDCVKLNSKPKGKWYCPGCRGDSHKIMRKFHASHVNNSSPSSSSNYNFNSSSYRTK